MKIVSGRYENLLAPRGLQKRIAKAGGYNIYGAANFRIVWGQSRVELVGGDWPRVGPCYKLVPKYGQPRWVIEHWQPPLTYGLPEDWVRQTHEWINGQWIETMGPYPNMGDYEYLLMLEEADGGFVQLTNYVCDRVVEVVTAARGFKAAERKNAKIYAKEKLETDWDKYADQTIFDHMPVAFGAPHAFVPRNYKRRLDAEKS